MASRRSSVYGRPSLAGGAVGAKDITEYWPIKDKAWQRQVEAKITAFLSEHKYPQILGPRTLSSPTKKEFEQIFKFIYGRIDPGYMYAKKFEEEVPQILRHHLRYPFAESISKSALHAVGSVQSWPKILAMLYWMVELMNVSDHIDVDAVDQLPPINSNASSSTSSGIPRPSGSLASGPSRDNALYALLLRSYQLRAQGRSDDDVANDIQSQFGAQNDQFRRDIEQLSKQCEAINKDMGWRKSQESPMVAVTRERETLEAELRNIRERNYQLDHERRIVENGIRELQDEAAKLDSATAELQARKRELDARLERQEISRAEAERMATEKEKIMQDIGTTEQRIKEQSQLMWDKECDLQKRLHDAEAVYAEYRDLAKDLALIPSSGSAFARAQGVDFELDLNVHSADPQGMSAAVQRARVRPALGALRTELHDRLRAHKTDRAALAERADAVQETLSDMRTALEMGEHAAARLGEDLRTRRAKYEREITDLTTELAELEIATKRARDNAETSCMSWANKRQKAQIGYDQAVALHRERAELVHEEIMNISDYMIQVKEHIEKALAGLDTDVHALLELGKSSLDFLETGGMPAAAVAPAFEEALGQPVYMEE